MARWFVGVGLIVGLLVATGHITQAVVPTWAPAAAMLSARYLHTATALFDGRVLVTGGYNHSAGQLASAEAYDPAIDTWTSTPPMASARYYHTATRLADGRVLVVGGFGNGTLSEVELYDPDTSTWSPAASMGSPRAVHTATLLGDGRVLVVGGYPNPWSAETFNPDTGAWSAAPSPYAGRAFHTATTLSDGRVLIVGGLYGPRSSEIYSATAVTRVEAAPLPGGRTQHADALLDDGRVLVAGGFDNSNGRLSSAMTYSPSANAWTAVSDMSTARDSFTLTRRPDGIVLAVGGIGSNFNASVERFDPATNGWSLASPMMWSRAYHTATPIPGGRLLVAGGYGQSTYHGPQATVEIFGPPNSPPTADAGGDQRVTGCATCLSRVTLDASDSRDPDGDTLTYTWKNGASVLATTRDPVKTATVSLDVGTHILTLVVSDGGGGIATDTVTIVVEDTLQALGAQLEQCQGDVEAARTANADLARQTTQLRADLAAANAELARQTTQLRAELATATARLDAVAGENRAQAEQIRRLTDSLVQGLSLVERDMQTVFRDPGFAMRGADATARLRSLVDAIVALNQGRKEGLYTALGGKAGQSQ